MDYEYNWELMLQEPYYGMLVEGLIITLILVFVTSITSFIMGVLLAVGRTNKNQIISVPVTAFTEFLRNIPGVFWLLAWFMMVPMLFPDDIRDAINGYEHYGLFSAIIGLTFNNSPYISDILRCGISSIHNETNFNIRLSGMSSFQQWYCIKLPQTLLVSLPALNARFVHNLKNTSLAMVISVNELTWQSQEIESITFAGLEVTTVVTCIYIILAFVFSGMITYVEKYFHRKLRRAPAGTE